MRAIWHILMLFAFNMQASLMAFITSSSGATFLPVDELVAEFDSSQCEHWDLTGRNIQSRYLSPLMSGLVRVLKVPYVLVDLSGNRLSDTTKEVFCEVFESMKKHSGIYLKFGFDINTTDLNLALDGFPGLSKRICVDVSFDLLSKAVKTVDRLAGWEKNLNTSRERELTLTVEDHYLRLYGLHKQADGDQYETLFDEKILTPKGREVCQIDGIVFIDSKEVVGLVESKCRVWGGEGGDIEKHFGLISKIQKFVDDFQSSPSRKTRFTHSMEVAKKILSYKHELFIGGALVDEARCAEALDRGIFPVVHNGAAFCVVKNVAELQEILDEEPMSAGAD